MTTLKRCFCGKFRSHSLWIKPDKVQLDAISEALTRKSAKIESQMCDECKTALTGFHNEKASVI